MCEIGKHLRTVMVEPLEAPARVPGQTQVEEPLVVEVSEELASTEAVPSAKE